MTKPLLAHVLAAVSIIGIVLQFAIGTAAANEIAWGLPIVFFTAVTMTVGWLIARRRPQITLGWILLIIAVLFGTQGAAGFGGAVLANTAPGIARWLLWWGGDNQWSWLPPLILLVTQLPLRFPDGNLPSPRWRWFSRATLVALVFSSAIGMTAGGTVGWNLSNPTYLDWGTATDAVDLTGVAVLIPAFVGSVASLVVRYAMPVPWHVPSCAGCSGPPLSPSGS